MGTAAKLAAGATGMLLSGLYIGGNPILVGIITAVALYYGYTFLL